MELASLMRHFKVYITPDSAPMHIASAMGTPFIALFGPTDPARHVGPSREHMVLKADLKCMPCYSPHCLKNFRCMRKITVDAVFAAVKDFLSKEAVCARSS
jgi:ADP-heptose:LPS heptosyltransferase